MLGLGWDAALLAGLGLLLLALSGLVTTVAALVIRLAVITWGPTADGLAPVPAWCAPGEVSEDEFAARLERLARVHRAEVVIGP